MEKSNYSTLMAFLGRVSRGILAVAILAAIMVTSCVKDPNTELLLKPETELDLEKTVYVSVSDVDGIALEGGNAEATKALASRAITPADEDTTIYNRWVLQIDPTVGEADDVGTVVAARYINGYDL